MKIEFFTDNEGVHNVRFPGDAYASNEAILIIFYDHYSKYDADYLFKGIDSVLKGEEEIFEFGDGVDGELDSQFAILKRSSIKSRTYKLKTSELKRAIEKWLRFKECDKPNAVEAIILDAEVID